MRTPSAVAHRPAHRPGRPHLALVAPPAPARRVTRGERLAALIAGLAVGFVLAALAAALGGGDPTGSLATAAGLGGLLVLVLARARALAVRARRRRPSSRPATGDATPMSLAEAA